MFERVLAFLRDLPGISSGALGADDPRVAATALLYHVMSADGLRQDVEWERLKQVVSEAYGVSGAELAALLAAGEKADSEAIDLYAFTSVLMRHLDEAGRIEFIRLMWEVVYADDQAHELEENTTWRVAELLGVDRRDRIAMRQEVARRASHEADRSSDE
ncbi:putative tellurite resistance protein B-like protein [Mesorhizobium soli]|uniref:tellurite resistance TerB family protein n=1 Tax=Pseudaminobacter soli (ex Li et al. 2025) TaxID=1295366 RepID=UPI002475F82F|nr:TerB family tellurite resistance protein [Mesorhizobium soli]MDH6231490.1 putative tellurite resistance protein B-like protein [Mesorhizobium soli]